MAEVAVPVTPGSGENIDGFSLPDGKIQQAVAIGDGATNGQLMRVGSAGDLYVRPLPAATSTLTQPAISTTSGPVLAANANRLGATITNDATTVLYLALTATAATTSAYTVQVGANGGYYEVPYGYTGAITGILGAGATSGSARVTELSA